MNIKIINYRKELTVYSQEEENILANSLNGQPKYSLVIWNSELKTIRNWNGISFESVNELPNFLTGIFEIQDNILDIQTEARTAGLTKYKELIYSSEILTQINIWKDNTKTIKLYQTDFTYNAGILSQIGITRISDNFTYTKTFNYTNGNLTGINIT